MLKNKIKIIISITLGLISLFSYLYFVSLQKVFTTSPIVLLTEEKSSNVPSSTELFFVTKEQNTVYNFMKALRDEEKINFTEKTYIGMGKMITSINDIKSNGNFTWIYYVNGKKAEIGVSNYKINPGDVVSWKYEKVTY